MGKKKEAATRDLSKKERKALEKKAEALRAELAEREAAKAAKKAAKKGKAETPEPEAVAPQDLTVTAAAAEAKAARKAKREAETPAEVAERATPLSGDDLQAALSADTDAAKERMAAEDAEIRARLDHKRADRLAEMQANVAADHGEKVKALAKANAVEVVETEVGREFVAGASVAADEFAKPSEAPRELEEGRNGYKIIQLGADGKPDPRKIRQLTRVTTYVGNIDDETTLKQWDKRMLLEGLALDATSPESGGLIPKVNEIVHRRDVAIAKAVKADRKGKLGIGEVATLVADAEKVARDALNAIVEEAAELAGRNDKARAGTHLHALAEISDEKGVDEVRRMHEAGETILNIETGEQVPITATDLASIEAYAERMTRLGAKVIESEAVIVNDEAGYAGRLDRIIMARLPELVIGKGTPGEYVRPADQRARRYIADIKSGRIDLGAGKIARQLAAYALGDLYDLETGERTRHSAVRDVALVFHLPQGAGVCTVHAVDIKTGALLLKLSGDVRRARNTGRKLIDATVDIADPAVETTNEGAVE